MREIEKKTILTEKSEEKTKEKERTDVWNRGHFGKAQQASPKVLKTTRKHVTKKKITHKQKMSEGYEDKALSAVPFGKYPLTASLVIKVSERVRR